MSQMCHPRDYTRYTDGPMSDPNAGMSFDPSLDAPMSNAEAQERMARANDPAPAPSQGPPSWLDRGDGAGGALRRCGVGNPGPMTGPELHQLGESGPYAYLGPSQNECGENVGGISGGIGLTRGERTIPLLNERVAWDAGLHGGMGRWQGQDGRPYVGVRATGGIRTESEGWELGFLSGDVGIYDNGNTLTLGMQANAMEGARTIGGHDPESDSDVTLRGGPSAGSGLALRIHHGDPDGDEHSNLGIGMDLGPVSFDVTSELGWVRDIGDMWDRWTAGPEPARLPREPANP